MANISAVLYLLGFALFSTCEGQATDSPTIRLVGGTTQYEGRVEVYHNGEWQTVCDDDWDIKEAQVVCRQLRYGSAESAWQEAKFGEGSGAQWEVYWYCTGIEFNLESCRTQNSKCVHSEDASVTCSNSSESEGDVRLVGGATENEGRVEVYHNGEWGTVCDDGWDLNDASVVCRQLGYSGATSATPKAFFGAGNGAIHYDEVACSGSETHLSDCPHDGIGMHDCAHDEDSGVVCIPDLDASTIRLVGGTTPYEGRVEVHHNGVWQTVCDDSWGMEEAHVVCRQLGYGSAVSAIPEAFYGQGSGDHWAVFWYCTGSESSLVGCRTTISSCNHSEDASVKCFGPVGNSSDIRLVGGRNQYEGRVEVYRNGEWQTVCGNSWDIREAEVVCRQLGFQYANLALQGATFGPGQGGQWSRVWSCWGNEGSLESCSGRNTTCSHSEDASVICSRRTLSNGALRMVGTGSTQFGGRLEFYYNNTWGTICRHGWDSTVAAVACRQLGFVSVSVSDSSEFGSGTTSVTYRLDDVVCSGSESRLIDCNHGRIGNMSCLQEKDVGIVCTNESVIALAAIAGGVAGGTATGVICACSCCVALCACISFCFCYQRKKSWRQAAISTVRMTVAHPATVVIVNPAATLDKQDGTEQLKHIPDTGYDATVQEDSTSALYPTKMTYPSVHPAPGVTTSKGSPLQQLFDLPPDYQNAHPFAAPQ